MTKGLILNEDGYVTYPYEIFRHIEDRIISLNWRISNVECGGDGTQFIFPFENCEEYFMDGKELMRLLREHPNMQWWWGILSGFSKNIELETIQRNTVIFVQDDYQYLKGKISHIDPDASLELVAFDSSETYVITDDEEVIRKLVEAYPNAESLDKYIVFD